MSIISCQIESPCGVATPVSAINNFIDTIPAAKKMTAPDGTLKISYHSISQSIVKPKADVRACPGVAPWLCGDEFKNSKLQHIEFESCDIAHVVFEGSELSSCKFSGDALHGYCNAGEVVFIGATFKNVDFEKCDLSNAIFERCIFENVTFKKCILDGAQFTNCQGAPTFTAVKGTFTTLDCNQMTVGGDMEKKPLVIMPWNTRNVGWSASKVQHKLRDAQLVRVNFHDKGIDNELLKAEQQRLFKQIDKHGHARRSIPRQMIEIVTREKSHYPQLAKIHDMAARLVRFADGVVMPGGEDIPPELYGQEREIHTKPSEDIRRDWLDICLLIHIFNQEKPCLAICRSAQMASIVGTKAEGGGTLEQHVENHQYVFPKYRIMEDMPEKGIFAKIMKKHHSSSMRVFEYNHQFVKDLAPGLTKALKVIDKDVLKGEHLAAYESADPTHFFVGIQSHPEFHDSSAFGVGNFYRRLTQHNSDLYDMFISSTKKD